MIDTHSHLFAEEFADDLPQVIERAKAAGVRKVFMPNIDDTTIREKRKSQNLPECLFRYATNVEQARFDERTAIL